MDKEKVDKILKIYKKYIDEREIYDKVMPEIRKELSMTAKRNFVDSVDRMLITLSDDELFIIISKYNLEQEPYLAKWSPGDVPDEEIMMLEDWEYGNDVYYNKKYNAYKKLSRLIKLFKEGLV